MTSSCLSCLSLLSGSRNGVREPWCSSHPLWEGLDAPLIGVSGASPVVGADAGTPLADSPRPGCASTETGVVKVSGW